MEDLTFNFEGNVATMQRAIALAVSFAICKVATHIFPLFKFIGGTLPTITATIVILQLYFQYKLVT